MALVWLPSLAWSMECADLRRLEVSLDICQAHLGFDRERYDLAARSAAARASGVGSVERVAQHRLEVALSSCETLQCVRDRYWQEVQWLEAYVPPVETARPWSTEASGQGEPLLAGGGKAAVEPIASLQNDEWTRGPASVSTRPLATRPRSDLSRAHVGASNATASTAQGAGDESASAESPTPPRAAPETWQTQALVLSFWGLLGATALLLVLGATNRVVIFYDSADAWWSIAPFLAIVVGYLVVRSLAPSGDSEFASTFIQKAAVLAAILVAALAALVNYRNAIHHNRSLLLGIIVGTLKLAIAVFMAATVMGQLNRLMDSGSTRRQVGGALLILALIGVLWRVLVNGQRVYERRGWQTESLA